MLVAERRKRIRQPEILRFLTLLEGLSIVQDAPAVTDSINNILPLAREIRIVSIRRLLFGIIDPHGAPLATLDGGLQKAAQRSGVTIFARHAG